MTSRILTRNKIRDRKDQASKLLETNRLWTTVISTSQTKPILGTGLAWLALENRELVWLDLA
jgi:hypothetical protein